MLESRHSPRATISQTSDGWHLQIPAGPAGEYRLAQFDDYTRLPRRAFPQLRPARMSIRCRASDSELPGTWGFGLWNDPFAFSLGLQGTAQRLPALPNACWFFHASAENHLSFQNHLPGNGFLAQCFRSPKIPSVLLTPGVLALPLLISKMASIWLRKIASKFVREDSLLLDIRETDWHTYSIFWQAQQVIFLVDEKIVLKTSISPQGPLGTVIWIDNQYAAWNPDGTASMGTLENNAPGWLEIEEKIIGVG